MELKVFQIDAWREPDNTWTYNNSIPVGKVEINGEPTTRKLLKALYDKEYLYKPLAVGKFTVDHYFDYEGLWTIKQKSDDCPVFDLMLEE